jgi:excinuclease ABC subunit A
MRLEDGIPALREQKPAALTIIQDRIKLSPASRARFVEACEQAYHFGKGKLALFDAGNKPHLYSNRLHCARCDIEYREPSPALFSFNHPVGACPTCRGFGRTITIDYNLALPDRSKSIAGGVVKPWQTGQSAECQADMMKFCKIRKVPTNVPFQDLPKKWQDWVVNGDPDYGKDSAHEWPRAWYGIKGYFRWLESKSYKMHVRVLLSRYRAYIPCPSCHGKRFQPDSLLYRVQDSSGTWLDLAAFYLLPIRDALAYVNQLADNYKAKPSDPLGLVLNEVLARLGFLDNVGLGYLTLDRPTRSLSGGETERVNLTTCLGTRLVNTLFVLDEPSVGLHPRDTARLVRILEQLRNAGNSVVVVEHEAAVMRAADQIVDIGPGHGAAGGHVVFQGPFKDVLKSADSLTGQYLAGRKRIETSARRKVNLRSGDKLSLTHATLHNLKDLSVEIPLGRLVCVSGVSGSGKSTLIREILLPMLTSRLGSADSDEATPEVDPDAEESVLHDAPQDNTPSLAGWQSLGAAILVDQSILAKTPRSNPAVYTGAFDHVRELFASSEIARQRGFNASAFSFNSGQGQCERCRGAGFEKIEMQFLSDVFIRCPECNGRRYRPHILEIKIASPRHSEAKSGPKPGRSAIRTLHSTVRAWSVGDFLDATVDDAIVFLSDFSDSRHAQRALSALKLLQEVGLGYLQLGQPINTLSGGESQRLKLVRHLAESVAAVYDRRKLPNNDDAGNSQPPPHPKPTLFLFDEPTTGLHFDDVRVLLKVFQRLVDAGHSVVIIEHNLDVIKSVDWVIDLGPDAGDQGGEIVAQGTPEQIAACAKNHTGQALKEVLG